MTEISTLESTRLRILLDKKLMWYCSIMYGLDISLGESVYGTAHTDGLKIVIQPEYWESLTEAERIGLLLHEMRHITDLHKYRKGKREPMPWNCAADYVINNELIINGYILPEGGLIDTSYKDMSVEEVYEILLSQNPEMECPMPDIMFGDDGDNGDSEDNGDNGGNGNNGNNEGNNPSEDETIARIKDLVIQATQQAKMHEQRTGISSVPFHIERLVHEWLNPTLPWDDVLRRYFSSHAKEDFSWQRRSRRYISHNLYMPSLYSENMGEVNVYIDGSSSVSESMFSMQIGQLKWIHTHLHPKKMRIILFNTSIQSIHEFNPTDKINVKFYAHGGTDVSEVLEDMKENTAEVNLLFSDGYFTKHNTKEINTPILCCIYDNPTFTWKGTKVIHIPKE